MHIPEIDVVVAGDSIYNEIHPMLGLSTPEEWQDWLETVDLVEKLAPKVIVAGHRRPDGDDHAVDTMIAETRSYIQDFAAAYETADDAEDLVRIMSAKYPGHGNLWTLQFSAMNAIAARDGASITQTDTPRRDPAGHARRSWPHQARPLPTAPRPDRYAMHFASLPDHRADLDPHGPAISDGRQSLTNAELLIRVRAAAHHLHDLGIGVGDVVADETDQPSRVRRAPLRGLAGSAPPSRRSIPA